MAAFVSGPANEFTVRFGAKAKTFIYEDPLGLPEFHFTLHHSGTVPSAGWSLVLLSTEDALGEPKPRDTDSTVREAMAAERVKEFARRFGYVVAES